MFCTFRVSGNAKPHRGLVFFFPKNRIPTGVLGIQSVWKCKTPPGSVVFLSKNEIPTGVSDFQGVGKCKTPPGSGVFLSKKWNPHRGLGLSGCREVQNPTGVCRFFIQKIESPPGSRAFRVSGNAKPHRGLVFFCPKNEIPAGV